MLNTVFMSSNFDRSVKKPGIEITMLQPMQFGTLGPEYRVLAQESLVSVV